MFKINAALVLLFLSSFISSAQTSFDTLALFSDTTTFQGRGSRWVDDVVNWGVRFRVDSTKEYTLKSLIVMGYEGVSATNPSTVRFKVSTGNLPEDSVIYTATNIFLTAGYPDWQTINLDPPVIIKKKPSFYITGGLLLSTAISIKNNNIILDQFTLRDRGSLFKWYEGVQTYFAIKSVVERQTTGINDNKRQNIKTYSLSQNYPNPFNSETIIRYYLPMEEKVKVEVTDMLGRVVKELYSGFQKSGEHKLSFNAEGLTGGIYFIRMLTPSFSDVKKVVYLK